MTDMGGDHTPVVMLNVRSNTTLVGEGDMMVIALPSTADLADTELKTRGLRRLSG